MRPLAFQFKEKPTGADLDFSLIEYDDQLNLSVNALTRQPAIDSISMDTETFTRADGEVSDSDKNGISMLMDTDTFTKVEGETSDSDNNSIYNLIDSERLTLVNTEGTDSYRDRMTMQALLDTSTLTESTEATDQDKDWK